MDSSVQISTRLDRSHNLAPKSSMRQTSIGDLATEIQDNIFDKVTSAEVRPFLWQQATFKSAKARVWQHVVLLVHPVVGTDSSNENHQRWIEYLKRVQRFCELVDQSATPIHAVKKVTIQVPYPRLGSPRKLENESAEPVDDIVLWQLPFSWEPSHISKMLASFPQLECVHIQVIPPPDCPNSESRNGVDSLRYVEIEDTYQIEVPSHMETLVLEEVTPNAGIYHSANNGEIRLTKFNGPGSCDWVTYERPIATTSLCEEVDNIKALYLHFRDENGYWMADSLEDFANLEFLSINIYKPTAMGFDEISVSSSGMYPLTKLHTVEFHAKAYEWNKIMLNWSRLPNLKVLRFPLRNINEIVLTNAQQNLKVEILVARAELENPEYAELDPEWAHALLKFAEELKEHFETDYRENRSLEVVPIDTPPACDFLYWADPKFWVKHIPLYEDDVNEGEPPVGYFLNLPRRAEVEWESLGVDNDTLYIDPMMSVREWFNGFLESYPRGNLPINWAAVEGSTKRIEE